MGVGTIVLSHKMTDGKQSTITLNNVLFVPQATCRIFSPTFALQWGCEAKLAYNMMSIINKDGITFITGPREESKRLYFFTASTHIGIVKL